MAVTRTPKIENPNVVKVDTGHGQFLHFTIDAVGPVPIFTFASSVKGVLYEATDFPGHPKTKYVRPTRKEADCNQFPGRSHEARFSVGKDSNQTDLQW